jgi:formylglycine-generating enzyme
METCSSSGQWGTETTCTYECLNATDGGLGGSCGGVCVPNATQCSGNGVETCGSNAEWGSATACAASQTCLNGACAAMFASCQASGPGLTNCGAASESCCTSLEVTGGTYYRTYDDDNGTLAADGGPTGEADPATVSGFRLDKYLVTVGRFRQFVNAVLPSDGGAGWLPPAGSGKQTQLNGGQGLANSGDPGTYETGWNTAWNGNIAPTNTNLACGYTPTWTNTAGSQENLPIDCVNWYEAYAFCIWDGGFLPSAAEGEYAAAGGSQQREYPWGSTDAGTANQYAIYACYYPSNTGTCPATVANVAPVGTPSQGAGLWGQLDLAGDMNEWNLDEEQGTYVDPCTDCAYLSTSASLTDVAFRGGYFAGNPEDQSALLSASVSGIDPVDRFYIGLRCARTP